MPFIGNQPAKVPLTSADITDGIITNADIANSTINLTTKVTGSLPVANGGTGLTALGTANQVLAVNSGATALEYQAVSSDFVRLSTSTITANTASVTFDGFFSSTYDTYIIYGNNILFDANANLNFLYRVSGSDVTSSYTTISHVVGTDTSHELQYAVNHSGPQINYNSPQNSGNDHLSFRITIHDPNNNQSVNHKLIQYEVIYYSTAPSLEVIYGGQINRNSTTALSGFKINPTAGNFDSGTMVLYGVKK